MSATITVAAPATTAEVAADMMAYQSGQSGVVTDINPGAQFRTLAENIGQVSETEGVAAQALAFQAIVYSCWAAFGILPIPAIQAQGTVTFSTGTSLPPPATQNVTISAGTIVQTTSGIQFQTLTTVTLLQGDTSIDAPIIALQAGTAGNVAPGSITIIAGGAPPYPLYVTNAAATTGGANTEAPSATMARFTAAVAAIGLASPVAIANSAIGVQAPSSTETVLYSALYEPGVNPNLPLSAQTAGWTLYLDNGTGTASSALIAAVTTKLNGLYPTLSGYRDAGVPYGVAAVTPVGYSVTVNATLYDSSNASALTASVQSAIQQYQTALQFGQNIQVSQLNTVVGVVLDGYASAFTVTLLDHLGVPQTVITVGSTDRAQLLSTTITL